VDAHTKALTVTTYGVDWYSPAEVIADPAAIIDRPITVRQRFTVTPATPVRPCTADLNDDGVVDGTDLGTLIGQWSAAGGNADLNLDGRVDGADLGILVAEWGLCAR
jgi:3-phytase/alkaline phosphatase D